jgi:hypothetical protein
LDRLAAEKKKEKLKEEVASVSDEPSSKRSKVYSYKTGEEEAMEVDSRRSSRNENYDDRDRK